MAVIQTLNRLYVGSGSCDKNGIFYCKRRAHTVHNVSKADGIQVL